MSNETEEKGDSSDKRKTETFDAATGKPDPTPRRIDLSNLRDIRLELAALYRKVDADEIDSRDGSRRAFILKTLHDVIVSAELERRIIELEEKHEREVARRGNDPPALPYQH